MDELLDIAEVARRSGLTPSALRFYERRGLIGPDGRNGLRRTYRPEVLTRLARIRAAATAGFSLRQIAALLTDRPTDAALRRLVAERAREVDAQIEHLTAIRESLHHAETCRHPSLAACPHFLTAGLTSDPCRHRS
ncbi:MAG TPA: MerR family transcriptional regulator [Actinocatenispora sp.]